MRDWSDEIHKEMMEEAERDRAELREREREKRERQKAEDARFDRIFLGFGMILFSLVGAIIGKLFGRSSREEDVLTPPPRPMMDVRVKKATVIETQKIGNQDGYNAAKNYLRAQYPTLKDFQLDELLDQIYTIDVQ